MVYKGFIRGVHRAEGFEFGVLLSPVIGILQIPDWSGSVSA